MVHYTSILCDVMKIWLQGAQAFGITTTGNWATIEYSGGIFYETFIIRVLLLFLLSGPFEEKDSLPMNLLVLPKFELWDLDSSEWISMFLCWERKNLPENLINKWDLITKWMCWGNYIILSKYCNLLSPKSRKSNYRPIKGKNGSP